MRRDTPRGRTVALVDWKWVGHHPMFFKDLTRALLELDCRVLALCPRPDEVRVHLAAAGCEAGDRLELQQLNWPQTPKTQASRWRRRLGAFRTFYQVNKRLRFWHGPGGRGVDLVFFACIYDDEFGYGHAGSWVLPHEWSGLYLHCNAVRNRGRSGGTNEARSRSHWIARARRLRALAVLDEGASEDLAALAGRPVVVFPDLTDEGVGDRSDDTAARLRRFAGGAPIVGCLGYLQPSKGVVTLARLALDDRYRDVRFAFVGHLQDASFTSDEIATIRRLATDAPNAFVHFERLRSEAAFNAVLQACDVVFAGYLGFPHSSNLLTKAAAFERPVIVSDGHLMAQRVRRYRLGEIVREGDPESTGRAIREILGAGGRWAEAHRPGWAEYRRLHSYERLRGALEELLTAEAPAAPRGSAEA